jgi:predicted nuclease with TOPRIM domain
MEKAKNNEVSNLMVEKDRLKSELDRIKGTQDDHVNRLSRELDDAKASLLDMSKSKGVEVQSVISRFNSEKQELERLNASYLRDITDLRQRLDESLSDVGRTRAANEEEGAVLQSGLDQTLLALANLQKSSGEKERALHEQLRRLQGEQIAQLNRMMDNILQTCIVKIEDAVYELEGNTNEGNVNASPEYVLSLLEKTQGACGDFANSFIRLVQV